MPERDPRERLVSLGIATLLIVALSTEALGAFHWLGRLPLIPIWFGIAILWWRTLKGAEWRWTWNLLWLAPVFGIWALEGLTALVSPPNSSDAMAYHMPRVVYWIQQRGVEFFATPYLNQIMLQPLHEYVILHFQLLSGGDSFANCVAWLSTGGYVIAVSLLARVLGAGERGQAIAALCAVTLPNGILQASGVKNEALLSFLLVSMIYFALRKRAWPVAAALALACFTKGTAYLFAAPLLLAFMPRAIPHALLLLLVVNGPFYWRNYDLSGSILGFDSAHADGRYRWRNEYLGWRPLVSNALRSFTEQLGTRDGTWNRRVYEVSVQAHGALGLNPNDPATTWPHTEYATPRNANHETDANNRWHLLLLALATAYFIYKREKQPLLLIAAMLAGALAFCFYLKWQPFMSRMWLPLFATGMSVAGLWLGRQHWLAQAAVCILLIDGTRLSLLKNWTRPLRGPGNMFQLTREDLYYSDMRTYNVRKQYDEVLSQLRASPCRDIGMEIEFFQFEYPIQALLLREHPETRFVHLKTLNPSKKYEYRTDAIQPCAVVCLACDRWLELR